jgi:hypothetical protein
VCSSARTSACTRYNANNIFRLKIVVFDRRVLHAVQSAHVTGVISGTLHCLSNNCITEARYSARAVQANEISEVDKRAERHLVQPAMVDELRATVRVVRRSRIARLAEP